MWESAYCTGWVDSGKEGSNCCMGRLLFDIGPPLSLHEQLNTAYSFQVVDYRLLSLPFRIIVAMCAVYVVASTGLAISRLNHSLVRIKLQHPFSDNY